MVLNKARMHKRFLGVDVLTAARQRIAWVFDEAEQVCVSFSGGKDSTCLLHLTAEEARRRRRRVAVMFVDWEAQYKLTIEHVSQLMEMYRDCITPLWITVPLKTTNACSMFEPEWICWEHGKEDRWVRPMPKGTLREADLPFYYYAMTFEEFVPAFAAWHGQGKTTAFLIGIRTAESLNRWRTIASDTKERFRGRPWTTIIEGKNFNAYPIYDWAVADDWTYLADKPYNHIYDHMHLAGLTPSQMRLCEPYGDEQRRGLWLYHVLEPESWGRVVQRVAGANAAALYANEPGSVMGNGVISKPSHMTWKAFAEFLLATMPQPTAEHYRNKIAVWLRWYQTKGGFHDAQIHDEMPGDLGQEDMPSWRRVCKVLLKNDYWCRLLSFAATKASGFERYAEMMKKRRAAWGLI